MLYEVLVPRGPRTTHCWGGEILNFHFAFWVWIFVIGPLSWGCYNDKDPKDILTLRWHLGTLRWHAIVDASILSPFYYISPCATSESFEPSCYIVLCFSEGIPTFVVQEKIVFPLNSKELCNKTARRILDVSHTAGQESFRVFIATPA